MSEPLTTADAPLPVRVVTLYRFAPFADLPGIRDRVRAACCAAGAVGTILLATEGINGTIAGADVAIDGLLATLRALPGCADLTVRESRAATPPFRRLKVRIRAEIVTMGMAEIDPAAAAGHYVEPEDWNALIDDPDTIVIDTRNDYEVAVGSFAGAIDPRTAAFRDFPDWWRARRSTLSRDGSAPRVAMFCTGGIRCEKATAFLRAEGVEDVHHLRGGVLAYLDRMSPDTSRWRGECFVFDERVTVGHGLEPGSHVMCRACGMPIAPGGRPLHLERRTATCAACGSGAGPAAPAG